MCHAVALQAAAFIAFVCSFAVFYLTGLHLQSRKKSESSKAGEVVLALLSVGWFGTLMFLADLF